MLFLLHTGLHFIYSDLQNLTVVLCCFFCHLFLKILDGEYNLAIQIVSSVNDNMIHEQAW